MGAWWKRTLWRELEAWRKPVRNRTWGDIKEYIDRMFVNGVYEMLQEQMLDEIEGKFPNGVPSTDISRKNMKAYLIYVKFKDFTGQSEESFSSDS